MPAPFSQAVHDRVKRLLNVHSWRDVSEITGVGQSTIFAMRRRAFQAPETTCPRRPRPSDFAIQSRHLNHEQLRAHYRAGSRAITRWKRELSQ